MDYVKCGVIESLCAELIGTLIICGILLSGSTLTPSKTFRNGTSHKREDEHQLTNLSEDTAEPSDKALAYGLTITAAMIYTAHISGGHLNPAITLGALICKQISIILATCYVLAQIIGALIGEVLAKLIVEKQKPDKLESGTRPDFVIGVLASFIIVAVYLSVTDSRKFGKDVGSAPLTIGFATVALALSDDRISMNPAISLATSMHYEDFLHTWVDWIAPLLGGLMAGIAYRILTNYHDSFLLRVHYSNSLVTVTASNESKE